MCSYLNYDIYDMMPYDTGLDFISYETMPIFMKSAPPPS